MHISKEDKNPELYTETYDKWEDWMEGEVVYYPGNPYNPYEDFGLVTRPGGEFGFWAEWEREGMELRIDYDGVRFKKRPSNKNSEVVVLAHKTISIPLEIEYEGRIYVLKEDV